MKTTRRRIGSDDEVEPPLKSKSGVSASTSPGFTRPYVYETSEADPNSKRRYEPQGMGFRYDAQSGTGAQQPKSPTGIIIFYGIYATICHFYATSQLLMHCRQL